MDTDDARVDAIVEAHGGVHGSLTDILLGVQEAFDHLPKGAVERVAGRLGLPVSQVYSVACFYKAFSLQPRAPRTVRVCTGTACYARGADALLAEIERQLHVTPGRRTEDGTIGLEAVNCPGNCPAGPVMTTNGGWHGRVTPGDVEVCVRRPLPPGAPPSEVPTHD